MGHDRHAASHCKVNHKQKQYKYLLIYKFCDGMRWEPRWTSIKSIAVICDPACNADLIADSLLFKYYAFKCSIIYFRPISDINTSLININVWTPKSRQAR